MPRNNYLRGPFLGSDSKNFKFQRKKFRRLIDFLNVGVYAIGVNAYIEVVISPLNMKSRVPMSRFKARSPNNSATVPVACLRQISN